jgi:hypothetical protein
MAESHSLRVLKFSILLVSCILLLAGCCTTKESTYLEAVRKRIAEGPVAACCNNQGKAPTPTCEKEAKKRCFYVDGAKVTMSKFERLPHDSGAQIQTSVSGPKGSGQCTHQVGATRSGKLQVSAGTCSPAFGHH